MQTRKRAAHAPPRPILQVLLLLPFRSSAYHAVLRLLRLAIKETRRDSIQNKERFMEEFGPGGEKFGLVWPSSALSRLPS